MSNFKVQIIPKEEFETLELNHLDFIWYLNFDI